MLGWCWNGWLGISIVKVSGCVPMSDLDAKEGQGYRSVV